MLRRLPLFLGLCYIVTTQRIENCTTKMCTFGQKSLNNAKAILIHLFRECFLTYLIYIMFLKMLTFWQKIWIFGQEAVFFSQKSDKSVLDFIQNIFKYLALYWYLSFDKNYFHQNLPNCAISSHLVCQWKLWTHFICFCFHVFGQQKPEYP